MKILRYALNIVLRRKLRTFLTSLGITIAVVLLSFIIFGMQDLQNLLVSEINSRFDPNKVIIGASMDFFQPPDATYDDETKEKAILSDDVTDDLEEMDGVEKLEKLLIISGMQITLEGKDKPYDQAFVGGWDVSRDDPYFVEFTGDEFVPEDGKAFVAMYVANYYKMEPEEMIGMKIKIQTSQASFLSAKSKSVVDKSYEFEVSGVYDPGGDRMDAVMSTKDAVNMQADLGGFESSEEYIKEIGYDSLFVTVDVDRIDEFKDTVLEKYGHEALTSDDFLSFLDTITNGLTIALIMFALVSAVVAGIGIINTMIMSIYEQTKEIGVIKAIGASNSQVLSIFLVQSGFIGLLGGALGLSFVYLAMLLLDRVVVDQLANAGFTVEAFFHFDFKIALIIAVSSIVVGVLAGIYPATRAARLDPVKALRYE